MNLDKKRKQIDRIDEQIIKLLNRRAQIVIEIGKEKRKAGIPAYSPSRERQILDRLSSRKMLLPRKGMEAIFREIISASRSIERPLTVAFLGPRATFTEMAAIKKFGRSPQFLPMSSIPDVFKAVENGDANFGVVPIENSNEGSVSSTLDMFFGSPLKIYGEVSVEVAQCLLSRSGLENIKKVYSHPQAIAQCQGWIRKNLPCAEIIETSSTAAASERASEEKKAAAIASRLAAEEYGLDIVAERIQDQSMNRTRFLVIGDTEPEPTGKDKTSVLFVVRHRAGALYDALGVFNKYSINMTKIESRPIKGLLWEYAFFVDFQGNVAKALEDLKEHTLQLKVLGSYPEES
ncbi:MAG: prephenate dehydratase [Candidatus Micrarchaeia archaeon]